MPPINFIFGAEKKKIIEKLGYYGIKDIPHLLIESGKEKIRGYTGSLSTQELIQLNQAVGIQLAGLYLFHDYGKEENLRLSFDAISSSELKSQITKNILEISEENEKEFLKGHDIALSKEEKEFLEKQGETLGFKIVKSKKANEFLGTGKLTQEGRIVNYMPKERRIL
jgi:NOL1/NOP2/fmu family ribosome biogenesis protein